MRKLNYKLLGLAAIAVAFTACEEGDLTASGDVEAAMGELYVSAEGTASRMFKHADEAMRKLDNGDALPYTINEGTFDVDPNNANRYILDYGVGKTPGGVLTEGKLIVERTGTNYLTPGSSVLIGFDEYKEAGQPITGSIDVNNVSDANTTIFDLDVTNLTLMEETSETDGDGNAIVNDFVLNTAKTLTWTDGSATLADITDDKYTISDQAGSSTTAAYKNGDYNFSVSIMSPLKIANDCNYRLTEGVIDLVISTDIDPSPLTFTNANIDFIGDDGCDKFFTIDLENTDTGTKITDLTRQFGGF